MKKIIISICAVLSLSACATMQGDPNMHAKQMGAGAAALGAVAGAIIGYQGDHSGGALRGALVGGALGGLAGGVTGHYMDKQEGEFRQTLAAEQRSHQLEIQRLKNDSLKITMNSEVSFDYDSTDINPAFEDTLNKISDILVRYPNSRIEISGYTDNVGSEAYNQRLSEFRAMSVKHYLEDRSIPASRISTYGYGESNPRVSNSTRAGRQLNRRVEMLIVPSE